MNDPQSSITSSEPASADGPARPAPRQLWQAPVFLVGLLALLLAWLLRPGGDHVSRHLASQLKAARAQLNRPDGNLSEAADIVQKVLLHADQSPGQLAEAYLLLGTVRLRQGDRAEAGPRPLLYQEARQHLQEAERLGLRNPREQAVLQYRLAKVAYMLGDNPRSVADRLGATIDGAEEMEQVEAYNLLTNAYLRLPQPDYKAALAANEKLRRDIARVPEEVLCPARLMAARLLLKLNRQDEARKVLKNIGAQAPAEVQAQARLLLARIYQDERNWAEAAPLWQKSLGDAGLSQPERVDILYHLGLCQKHLGQTDAATRSWQECCRSTKGEHGQAAAVGLADLFLQAGQPDKALPLLTLAVKETTGPEGWTNRLINLPKLREVFDRAAQVIRQTGKFELAGPFASQYERVALAGKAAQVLAELTADWGRATRSAAEKIKEPDARNREEDAARDRLSQAGAAYAKTAAAAAGTPTHPDLIWLAAACFREAGDSMQTVSALQAFLKVNQDKARACEAWYLLGETLRQDRKQADADRAYEKCLEFQTPHAYRARYQLARAEMERGNLDNANKHLTQNLQLLRDSQCHDDEAHEWSLFALGKLNFEQRNYRNVVRYLEEALNRFPTNPGTVRAMYQLGESYRQLAARANQEYLSPETKDPQTREHEKQEYFRQMSKAADQFYNLAQLLDKPDANRGSLSPEEIITVSFIAAECRFFLGRYTEALEFYEVLAERYKDRPQRLLALGCCVRCHYSLQQADKLKQRLDEINSALAAMDGDTRKAWESWLADVTRYVMSKPNNAGGQ